MANILLLFIVNWLSNTCSADTYAVIGGFGPGGIAFTKSDPLNFEVIPPQSVGGKDPSTFIINTDHSKIYTASNNSVVSISFDENFIFGEIKIYETSTFAPVFLSTDENFIFLYAAAYGYDKNSQSGFQIFSINPDNGDLSLLFDKNFADLQPPNNVSHCHCIVPHPDSAYHFYVADLGRSVVEHYAITIENTQNSVQLRNHILFAAKAGPRTLSFHPTHKDVMYVTAENAGTVSRVSLKGYDLKKIEQTLKTMPNNSPLIAQPSHVGTDKNAKYLYVGNRNNLFKDDSLNNIAIYRLDGNGHIIDDSLQIAQSGGQIPRYLKVDPKNEYLFVANQQGMWEGAQGNLSVFKIDHSNGQLGAPVRILNCTDLGYEWCGLSWIDFIEKDGNLEGNAGNQEYTTGISGWMFTAFIGVGILLSIFCIR